MHTRANNDECVICQESLLKGLSCYARITEDRICYACRKQIKTKLLLSTFDSHKMISLYSYEEAGSLLIRYKDYLDVVLAPVFMSPILKIMNCFFKGYEIVLIPSSDQMLKRRGFNHLSLMLEGSKLPIVDCLLKEDTIQRFSHDRRLNFSLKKDHNFDKVILFDDVITSGNSMRAALEIIKPLASKIVIISLINNMK